MKRRSFLGLLGGAVAVPFAKVAPADLQAIVDAAALPTQPVAAVVGNRILSPEIVAREALSIFQNNLAFNKTFAGGDRGAPNSTIRINHPANFARSVA